MGRPIEITSEPADVTGYTDDQIVVSVGPYMFHNWPHRGSNCAASSPGNASPPQSALRRELPFHPLSRRIRQVAGVACRTVTFQRLISAASCFPSVACSREARTILEPVTRGR